jgi:hypothetical protein
MLYEFRDRLVLEHKRWWFVWEEAWDCFRPIDGIRWDGVAFVFDDREYCTDPSDPLYGYRTQTMKDLCDLLGETRLEELPKEVDALDTGNTEWFFDRRASLTTCAPRNHESWKRMVQGRGRTCRKAPRGEKDTRRRRRGQI